MLVYIIVEKYLFLRSQECNSRRVINAVKTDLLQRGKQNTLIRFKAYQNGLSRVACHAIEYAHLDPKVLQDNIKNASLSEIEQLEKKFPLLSSIITIAPILGLMGTVLGIMDVFSVISGGDIGRPELLSEGISEALITTVAGLAITIPGVLMYHYFRQRVDMMLLGMEKCACSITLFIKSNPSIQE
jgi:biopolymer transport protein ExbB